MEKWLCWGGIAVGGLLLVLFLLDLVLKIAGAESFLPFGGLDYVVDAICLIASALLLFLSLDAYKDMR